MFVQDWLDQVPLAPKTKSKIKALMHRLFEKAMFWELIPIGGNPMALVEIEGASRRRKKPIILTVDQYFAVLELLPEPYRTMVVVAQCLGLRVSEILALQWRDINFSELTMRVTRGVVDGVVDEVKTEYSEDELPPESVVQQTSSWPIRRSTASLGQSLCIAQIIPLAVSSSTPRRIYA